MYDAWDYGPGNANDVGVTYGWESAATSGGSSWGQGIFGLASEWLRYDAQKEIMGRQAQISMQQAADGRRYMEGQPVVMNQGGGLVLSPGLLLIGALVAFAMMAKD